MYWYSRTDNEILSICHREIIFMLTASLNTFTPKSTFGLLQNKEWHGPLWKFRVNELNRLNYEWSEHWCCLWNACLYCARFSMIIISYGLHTYNMYFFPCHAAYSEVWGLFKGTTNGFNTGGCWWRCQRSSQFCRFTNRERRK